MAHEQEPARCVVRQASAAELAAQQAIALPQRALVSLVSPVSASAVAAADPWYPWPPLPGAPPCLDDGGYTPQPHAVSHAVRTACWHDPLYVTY